MRIVVCLTGTTVLKIGFNLDQKMCITPHYESVTAKLAYQWHGKDVAQVAGFV